MSFLRTFANSFDPSRLLMLVIQAAVALLCIIIHECAHGFAADRMGDHTARRSGRLSWNPLRHIDPLGLLMMFFVGFGWAKPVPVDMRYFKNPKSGMALTALAGPLSNFVLAIILLLICKYMAYTVAVTAFTLGLYQFLFITAFLSVGLGTFNLLPIPPLDGSKVLFSFLPDRMYLKLMYYERYGMILLLAMAFLGAGNGFLSMLMNMVFRGLAALIGFSY